MKRLQRHRHFLQDVLTQAQHKQRQVQLQAANADQVNALSELSLNLLKKHIPVQPATVKQLYPHRHTLRTLANRRVSLKRRRALLMRQKGGGLWKGLAQGLKLLLEFL